LIKEVAFTAYFLAW